MAATFFDLIVVALCPLVLSAAAWIFAIKAPAETDEISKVVEFLTRPDCIEENAKRGDVLRRRNNLIAIASGIQPPICQGAKAER